LQISLESLTRAASAAAASIANVVDRRDPAQRGTTLERLMNATGGARTT